MGFWVFWFRCLIFYIDESGFVAESARVYGYSPKGERCIGLKNGHEKGRVNAIGNLLNGKLLTVALFSGTVNSTLFLYWVLHPLLPLLPANSVVVMDNASFHKRADIQRAFREAGHPLEY